MSESRSVIKNIFNVGYYKQLNEDVLKDGGDPFEHYLLHGYKEGRKPSNIIEMDYFISNRSITKQNTISLNDISDLLVDIKWSDVFSCHPLVCPSWISLQINNIESVSFVENLSNKLEVNEISLHPGLKVIQVQENETLGDIIGRLSEIDVQELSIVDLKKYRIEHSDIKSLALNDMQCLIHLWSTGIFENRLKYIGSSAPRWASNESVLKINCLLMLQEEGKDRFYPVWSKIKKIKTNRVKYNFNFDVHRDFINFKVTPDIEDCTWSKIFEIFKAVCSGREIAYSQRVNRDRQVKVYSKANSHKEITDVELLSGSTGLPHSTRVCYSINLNGYDDFPTAPDLEDCQYFLVTDAVDLPEDKRWIIVRPTLMERDDKRLCLWYKTHPHLLFNWHPFSTWIDSNIQSLSGCEKILYAHEAISEIATFAHPDRTCVYEEAKILKKLSLDLPEVIDAVVDGLKSSGMPQNYGLFETNVLFANLNDYLVREFFNEWWLRVNSGSRRDQMAFSPSAWTTGVRISPLDGSGASSAKNNKYFTKTAHKNEIGRKVV